MFQLSRLRLPEIRENAGPRAPAGNAFSLPEKVLQFGTGVLLRGLPDFFIEKANRAGMFNGRIVMVKSTGGGVEAFERQDNLYTLLSQGLQGGEPVEEHLICSAISRVLPAQTHWPEVLACAANPDLQIVISNTTEVGIRAVEEDIRQSPPGSFPGKLLAFLYARYRAFSGDPGTGLVIVPTELIPGNGAKLASILNDLARFNRLEPDFLKWLQQANTFCNSLVDRIVPGKPEVATLRAMEERLGYRDELLTVCEPYRLWAIEGDERVRRVLSFAQADPGVIIEPDIDVYRELKLRLLNGTHTLSCGLAHLCGIRTVKEGMQHPQFNAWVRRLMSGDIATAIPYPVDAARARAFGEQVLERFANPYLHHPWLNITLQYSSKMLTRVVPVLREYYRKFDKTPEAVALGFAAYLLFMRPNRQENGVFTGEYQGGAYSIQDDKAAYFFEKFKNAPLPELPDRVLSDITLWGENLTTLPGFAERVLFWLKDMAENGATATLQTFLEQPSNA